MTGNTIKAVCFDLDNTLWDVDEIMIGVSEVQHNWLIQHRPRVVEELDARELMRFKESFARENPQYRHQISELRIQVLKAAQLAVGYTEEEAERGAREAFAEVIDARHQIEYFEHTQQCLAELSTNYRLIAVSNGNADVFRLDIGQYFHAAVRAEEMNASKPDPILFEEGLRRGGVAAHEAVHVGDHPKHDIEGAQAAGLHTIWYNGQGETWTGGDRADAEVNDLRDLAAAVAAIDANVSRPVP